MQTLTQKEIEALYSQRNIHTVLHQAIKYELNKLLLNWALLAFVAIPEWVKGNYYPSKNKRLLVLKEKLDAGGLESVVIALAAAVLHTHKVQTIQQVVGYLQAFLPHEDAFDRAITAAELLGLLSRENGLFTIIRNGSGNPATIRVNHWPFIDKELLYSFDWINTTCFNPPMKEPPKKVKDNYHCGYLSINVPLLLGPLTQHDKPQNYKVINNLNKIEWVLDANVLAEPELPNKPPATTEEHQIFSDMVRDSNFIYKLMGPDPFHICWQYDSRGRFYSHGYHINFQAAEYKKALLNFNHYEELT